MKLCKLSIFRHKFDALVLDTETNGLKPERSILQLSAIRFSVDNYKFYNAVQFNRFYYPIEPFYDEIAIGINGLTEDEISKNRGTEEYPKNFCFDTDFYDLCSGVSIVIGHNVRFDISRIPILQDRVYIDTMLQNKDNCKLRSPNRNGYKNPTLKECCEFYKIQSDKFHGALEDVRSTYRILCNMIKDFRDTEKK